MPGSVSHIMDTPANLWRKSLPHIRTKRARKCRTCAISRFGVRTMSDMGDLIQGCGSARGLGCEAGWRERIFSLCEQ